MRYRGLAVLLAALIFLLSLPPAWAVPGRPPGAAGPGGENAETHQVAKAGDVISEKETEMGLTPAAGLLFSDNKKKEETLLMLEKVETAAALAWMNWPMCRFKFALPQEDGILSWHKNVGNNILDFLANAVFTVVKNMVAAPCAFLFLAFRTTWTAGVAHWVSGAAGHLLDLSSPGSPARVLMLLGLCGLGIMAFFYLVRGRVASALKAFAVSTLMVTLVLGYAAVCGDLVEGLTELGDGLAGAMLSAAGAVSPAEPVVEQAFPNPKDRALAGMTNSTWQALVAVPWKYGEFGAIPTERLILTKGEWESFEENGGNEIPPDSEVRTQSFFGREVTVKRLGLNELEAMASKGSLRIDTLYLALASSDDLQNALLKALADSSPTVDHGGHESVYAAVQPESSNAWRHFFVASFMLLPALAFCLFALFFGGIIILCQILAVAMLVAAPVFLLLALVPGMGWDIGMKYLKLLLTTVFAKTMVGFYVSLVMSVALIVVRGFLG